MTTFEKYNKNLHRDGDRIISYTTHVATIYPDHLLVLGHWSKTTTKNVNYVAHVLGLNQIHLN